MNILCMELMWREIKRYGETGWELSKWIWRLWWNTEAKADKGTTATTRNRTRTRRRSSTTPAAGQETKSTTPAKTRWTATPGPKRPAGPRRQARQQRKRRGGPRNQEDHDAKHDTSRTKRPRDQENHDTKHDNRGRPGGPRHQENHDHTKGKASNATEQQGAREIGKLEKRRSESDHGDLRARDLGVGSDKVWSVGSD